MNPPSHAQNTIPSYRVMQFIGRLSLPPGVAVHVWYVASHLTAAVSAAVLVTRLPFQLASHPLPGMFACAPALVVRSGVRVLECGRGQLPDRQRALERGRGQLFDEERKPPRRATVVGQRRSTAVTHSLVVKLFALIARMRT